MVDLQHINTLRRKGDHDGAYKAITTPDRAYARKPRMIEPPEFFYTDIRNVHPLRRKDVYRMERQIQKYSVHAMKFGLDKKDLPQREDLEEPWYWWALDKIRTPNFVVNAVVNEFLDGDVSLKEIYDAMAGAVAGDVRVEGRDIVTKMLGDHVHSDFMREALGFGWDILADPLTFITFGALTKTGKMAKAVEAAGGIWRNEGKAELAVKSLYEFGAQPELVAKFGKEQGRNFFGRLLRPSQFTEGELGILKNFGATIDDATGMIQAGPKLLAAETKLGRKLTDIYQSQGAEGLERLIKGENLLEKIEKGQFGFINIFGRSMLPKGFDKAVYQAAGKVGGGAAKVATATPGMARFAHKVKEAGKEGKALFSTKTGIKEMDDLTFAESGMRTKLGNEYMHKSMKLYHGLKSISKNEDEVMQFIRAIEMPQLDQIRDSLVGDAEFRKVFVEGLKKYAPDGSRYPEWWTALKKIDKPEIDADDINDFFGEARKRLQANPEDAARWQVFWDDHLSEFTPYGGMIFGKAGVPLDDAIKKTEKLLEPFGDDVKQAATDLRDLMRTINEREGAQGLSYGWYKGYFPHIATEEAFKARNSLPMPMMAKAGGGKGFMKQREHYLFFDDWVRHMEIKAGGGEAVADIVVKDPSVASVIRGARQSAEATSQAWYYQQAMTKFGKAAGEVAGTRGYRQLSDTAQSFLTKLRPDAEGLHFADEVAVAMERKIDLASNPATQNLFTKTYQSITDWWKGWTLGVRPSFHTRNFVSILTHNWMAGMKWADMGEAHVMAGAFQAKIHGEWMQKGKWAANELEGDFWKRSFIDVNGKAYSGKDLAGHLQNYGVYGSGMFAAEAPDAIKHSLGGPKSILSAEDVFESKGMAFVDPRAKSNFLARRGFMMGVAVENNGRSALWLHKVLKEGYTPEEAAKAVVKWHFDYSDLTQFEHTIKNNLFPFYTWSRKNVALQFDNLVHNPGRHTWLDKVKDAVENGEEPDYYQVSNYIKDSIPIRTDYNPETGEATYRTIRNWMPMADLGELAEPAEFAVQMLGPVPKVGYELATNYSAFFDSPIERYPGQKRTMLGIDMPAKAQYAARSIGFLNELDRLNPGGAWDKVYEATEGKPRPKPFEEPDPTDKWVRFFTGLKSYKEAPADVLYYKEMEHKDNVRRVKNHQKREMQRINFLEGK